MKSEISGFSALKTEVRSWKSEVGKR